MNQAINLNKILVQVISDSSGIFCGENLQTNWRSVKKQNLGYGVISGDANQLPVSLNTVKDDDALDSLFAAAFPAPAGENLQSVIQNRKHNG